jgi:hypothetical protein
MSLTRRRNAANATLGCTRDTQDRNSGVRSSRFRRIFTTCRCNYEKVKQKTCDIIDAPAIPTAPQAHTVKIGKDENIAALITVDKRAHRVFKTIFHVPSSELGEIPKAVKWDDFKRVMVRVGFTAEKLQGCACQFMPMSSTNVERSIQFHEPHPNSDVPFMLARRLGRRLE